ncbi:MAG: hypothetical protein QW731_00190 [Thermofilaceae archaeon]
MLCSVNAYTPKLGVVVLGDPREEVPWREEEARRGDALATQLLSTGLEVKAPVFVARSADDAENTVKGLIEWGSDLILLYIPVWTYPSITVRAAEVALKQIPLIIVYGDVLSGVLASSGALGQVGARHITLWGPVTDVAGRISKLARAAMAVRRLEGETFGLIGGRALGMYTVTGDPAQVKTVFGVDVEHVDQLEVLRKAESISEEEVDRHFKWLKGRVGKILYDGRVLTEEKLKRQVRLYLSLKELLKERGFSFCGLKCQPELSDGYVNACVAVAELNDPYDADGLKEPMVCACESDVDGALTMQLLKLVSGGKPTTLMDLLVYDYAQQLLFMGNCGGMATWFAEASNNPEENLAKVHLLPQVQGKAGGAATQYVAPEKTFTVARFYRVAGRYHMILMVTESVRVDREQLYRSIEPWPHIVVKISPGALQQLVEIIGANHLHAVEGDYSEEVKAFCEIKGVELHEIIP